MQNNQNEVLCYKIVYTEPDGYTETKLVPGDTFDYAIVNVND